MPLSKTALLRWLAREERAWRNVMRKDETHKFDRAYALGQAHALARAHTWVQQPVQTRRKGKA